MAKILHHLSLILIGTILNSLLGLIFYVLVARNLEVSGFGYFSFLLGVGILVAEISDLGSSSALIKFGTKDRFGSIFSLTVIHRILASILIFIGLWAGPSAFVAVSLLLVSLITQSFVALQKYPALVATNILGNLIRLGLTFYLISVGMLTPVSAIGIFALANFIAFVFGAILLAKLKGLTFFRFDQARIIFPEVFAYSRNIAISFGMSSVSAKIDVPIIYFLGGPTTVGLYSSAQKLTSVLSQLAGAIENVFSPKFSNGGNIAHHFKDYFLINGLFAGLLILAIPFTGFLVPLIFGEKYILAIGVLNLLLAGLALFFLTGPLTAFILYARGKSIFLIAGSFLQLVVTLILYFLLIPTMGATGAAIAFVGANLVSLIYYAWLK